MEDLIKKLRILAIQEDKNREKAAHYLQIVENEISFALYRIYGRNKNRTYSKIDVHQDEGLVFIYDYTDFPDKEGFVFEKVKGFTREHERISDEKGERFWFGLEMIIEWIPKIISEIMKQEEEKLKLIQHLERITESEKENKKVKNNK